MPRPLAVGPLLAPSVEAQSSAGRAPGARAVPDLRWPFPKAEKISCVVWTEHRVFKGTRGLRKHTPKSGKKTALLGCYT